MAFATTTSIDLLLYGLLFVLFMAFFGIPSIEKYRKKETIVLSSEKMTNGIEAPAITFVPLDRNTGYGFKKKSNQTSSMMNRYTMTFLLDHCQEINQPDLENCISNDSFALTDFLKTASFKLAVSSFGKLNKSQWSEDILQASNGKMFTWNPQRIITRHWEDFIFLSVYRNLNYYIFIHDIDFYIISSSPRGATKAYWEVNGETMQNHYKEIALVKHKRLNLERQPCEEDEDYRFLDCVKESLAEQVGCRLPWEKATRQDREVCTKREQFKQFEKKATIITSEEINEVKRMTGCLAPCCYKEYMFLNNNPKILNDGMVGFVPGDQIVIGLWAVSRNTEFREEVSD